MQTDYYYYFNIFQIIINNYYIEFIISKKCKKNLKKNIYILINHISIIIEIISSKRIT